MNLQVSPLEPTPSALRKISALGYLRNSENTGIECACELLASGRHRQLDMFDSLNSHCEMSLHVDMAMSCDLQDPNWGARGLAAGSVA
jgi:hypothetical protein